jgi:hypothetical protein
MRRFAFLAIVLVPFIFFGCAGSESPDSSTAAEPQAASAPEVGPLEGAWRLVSRRTIAADGETTESTIQSSVTLFVSGHYSVAFSSGDEPFPGFADTWTATDEEAAARLAAIVVNTGTYELDGSRLITRPIFALIPTFQGGEAVFEWELTGDTLTLTAVSVTTADGVPLPALADGGRIVDTLTRIE